MSSDLQAWFGTRTDLAPAAARPVPTALTIAVASALDGTAEVRIVRHSTGFLTFEIEAWANFDDADGHPHVQWHTFHPPAATLSDSFERIVELATLDAEARKLTIGPFSRWPQSATVEPTAECNG